MRTLIIIGSAPCVADDLAKIPNIVDCDCMAVGLSSLDKYSGIIKYIANNHPENINKIREAMKQRGTTDYKIIGPTKDKGVDIVEPYRPPSGSSAITGALAAIRIGYDKIILAGCPLTGQSPTDGNFYEEFQEGWEAKKDELFGIVTSLSGWTKELLGEPEIIQDSINPIMRWDVLIDLGKKYHWKRGAELGVWYGNTFFRLLESLPDLFLIGVDDWRPIPQYTHHNDQQANRANVFITSRTFNGRTKIMEMTTDQAAILVPDKSLDFVFIDSFDTRHAYESMTKDIKNWLPKVKMGGFVTGHGYDFPEVKKAVDELFGVVEGLDYLKSTWVKRI